MNDEKLIEFNKELNTLLDKYGVQMAIEQKIVVSPKPTPEKVEAEIIKPT